MLYLYLESLPTPPQKTEFSFFCGSFRLGSLIIFCPCISNSFLFYYLCIWYCFIFKSRCLNFFFITYIWIRAYLVIFIFGFNYCLSKSPLCIVDFFISNCFLIFCICTRYWIIKMLTINNIMTQSIEIWFNFFLLINFDFCNFKELLYK